jgi:MscS family membrane protein
MKKDFYIKVTLIYLIGIIFLDHSVPAQDSIPDSLLHIHPNSLQKMLDTTIVQDSFSRLMQVDTIKVDTTKTDSQPSDTLHQLEEKTAEKRVKPVQQTIIVDTALQEAVITHPAEEADTVLQKPQEKDTAESEIKSLREILSTSKLFLSLMMLAAGWIFLRYLTKLLNIFAERWPQYRLTIKGLIPVIRIGSWTLILFFIIVAIIQPAIETIWAITASAGIAIGFASQDILKNIFGGILILMDKPFKVGDKIKIDDHYGEVVNIGLRTVRIVTPDDSLVSIPNSEIVNKSVSNANAGAPDCQVVAEFYFEKDIDMNKAHTLAIRCASISRYVFLNKPISATFKNEIYEGRSMIKMRLKAYVFDHRFEFAFITDMSKIIFREFSRAGLTA